MSQDKKIDLKAKVMRKIRDGKINFRSRYIFVAKKLGLGGGLTLSLILAALFLNLTFFGVKASGSLEFLSFGRKGILAFLESFPYHWILIGLAFFVFASIILSRYDISYKKPFKRVLVILLLLVFIAGVIISVSGVNEAIEDRVNQGHFRFLRAFYGKRHGMWRNALLGEIAEVKSDGLMVDIDQERTVFIKFTDNTLFPAGSDFNKGDYIRVLGEWEEEEELFNAQVLQIAGQRRQGMMGPRRRNQAPVTPPMRTLP